MAIRIIKRILLIVFLCLFSTASAASGFSIHFLDVGHGDAAIVLCGDEVMMIDCGDGSFTQSYLTDTLNINHIDYMIATHPHEDHIGGLAGVLDACTVETIYGYDCQDYANNFLTPTVGDTFFLGAATVQFLSPAREYDNVNDMSIIVKIVYGNTSFLFTGDAEIEAEYDLLESEYDLHSTVLKVGHHGSDTSSSYDFLRRVKPRYAIISVGENNLYGHPSEATLDRLSDVGATIYRTDINGTIVCHSDGNSLTFELEKDFVEEEKEITYIGNKNTKKFHYSSCSSVSDMKSKNKIEFSSRDKAINKGYVPCKRCNP